MHFVQPGNPCQEIIKKWSYEASKAQNIRTAAQITDRVNNQVQEKLEQIRGLQLWEPHGGFNICIWAAREGGDGLIRYLVQTDKKKVQKIINQGSRNLFPTEQRNASIGLSAVGHAVIFNQKNPADVIEELARGGADVNIATKDSFEINQPVAIRVPAGATALYIVVEKIRRLDVVKVLLQKKAVAFPPLSPEGHVLLQQAHHELYGWHYCHRFISPDEVPVEIEELNLFKNHLYDIDFSGSEEDIEKALKPYRDQLWRGWNGLTPLMWAASEGKVQAVRYLASKGDFEKINLGHRGINQQLGIGYRGLGGITAIGFAILWNSINPVQTVETLLEYEAEVNVACRDQISISCKDNPERELHIPRGVTPLWMTLEITKSVEVAKRLLQKGAVAHPDLSAQGKRLFEQAQRELKGPCFLREPDFPAPAYVAQQCAVGIEIKEDIVEEKFFEKKKKSSFSDLFKRK
ncbi:MAG: ankyrin repeat domain-containing protein [Verrucomicrobiota bacterium]|nr:ankyrin repeat domain-containing protein [Verrucomicrobiota bacterium]